MADLPALPVETKAAQEPGAPAVCQRQGDHEMISSKAVQLATKLTDRVTH